MSVEPLAQPAPLSIWPWLAKGVSIAFDPRKLILAAVGIALTAVGWAALDAGFGGDGLATFVFPNTGLGGPGTTRGLEDLFTRGSTRVVMPFRVLGEPWRHIFWADTTWATFFKCGIAGVWGVMVWGIIGGAIARIAVVEVATIERVGMISAVKFAWKRAYALIASPLAPLLIVAMFAIPGVALGAISRLGGVGESISGALGFVPVLCAIPIAITLVAVVLSWPLMHLTVVAEGEDIFDALSRSFSYLSQRTGRYAVLVVIALALGFVGETVLTVFAFLIMNLAAWTVSITAPTDGAAIALGANGPILALWVKIIDVIVLAWSYSYLWSAAAVIYLILRKEVDGTPTYDIYFPGHEADVFAPEPVKVTEEIIIPATPDL